MKFLLLTLLVCYVVATGEWREIDTDDESVQKVIQFAAKYVNGQFKSRYHHKLVETIRAKSQVVAGIQYEVKIALQETQCKKTESSFEEASDCDVRDGSFPKYCTVKVWEKSWENYQSVVSYACTSRRTDF